MSQYAGTRTNKGEAPPHVTTYRPPTPRSMKPAQLDAESKKTNSRTLPKAPEKNFEYEAGERVQYRPIGGPDSNTSTSTGVIERVLISKTPAGSTGVSVNASAENPQYEILNDNTKKKSALKGRNILGVVEKQHEEEKTTEL